MLTREAILGHVDKRIERVQVEEMGGEVCVASLTVAEMDQITKLSETLPTSVEVVIIGACDETGKRLFTVNDRAKLASLPATAMATIAKAVLEHNGLAARSAEEAKNGSSETAS